MKFDAVKFLTSSMLRRSAFHRPINFGYDESEPHSDHRHSDVAQAYIGYRD